MTYSCDFVEGGEEEFQRGTSEVVKVAGASVGEWLGHSLLRIGISCFLPR